MDQSNVQRSGELHQPLGRHPDIHDKGAIFVRTLWCDSCMNIIDRGLSSIYILFVLVGSVLLVGHWRGTGNGPLAQGFGKKAAAYFWKVGSVRRRRGR